MADKLPDFNELEELPSFGDLEEVNAQASAEELPSIDQLQEVSEPEKISQAESAFGGAKTGLTFGFRDELAGLAGAAGYGSGILEQGRAPSLQELLNAYRQARGEERIAESQERAANPKTFIAGEVGGGLLVPGMAAGKTIGQVAKSSAKLGALAGAGTSEADLTKGEVGDFVEDVGFGAGAGLATGAVFGGIGKGVKKVLDSRKLRQSGEKQILSALTPQRKIIEKELLTKKDGLKGIGKVLSEEFVDEAGKKKPIFSVGSRPEDVVENLEQATRQHLDEVVNPILDTAQDRINMGIDALVQNQQLSGNSFIDDIQKMTQKRVQDLIKKGQTQKAKSLQQYMDTIIEANADDLTGFDLKKLNQIKRMFGEEIKPGEWEKIMTGEALPTYQKEATKDLYYLLKGRIEDLADAVSKPGEKLGQKLKDANMKTSNLLDAKTAALYDHTRRLDNPSMQLKDMVLPSVAGVIASNPLVTPLILGGTFIVEKATGRKLGKVTELATGRGLTRLADIVEKMDKSKAGPILKAIRAVEKQPIAQRGAAIAKIVSSNPDIFKAEQDVKEAEKNLASYSNIINASKDEVNSFVSYIQESNDPDLKKYVAPLQKAANVESDRTRKAMLWGLSQQPAFREIIEKVKNKETGE